MPIQDLYQALQMFQSGVKEAATTEAVNDATDVMNQINISGMQEQQKRASLQNLANQLALKMTGTGASAASVQQAFNAVNPQNFGSVEQMQLEGALSGNKLYQSTAKQLIDQRKTQQLQQMQMEFGLKSALMDKEFNNQLKLEMLKLSKQNKELKPEELAFQTNVQVANKMLDELEQTINDKGTFELSVPLIGSESSNRAAAKLDSLPYQLAITYAKIVDPNSVARESEVVAAQKYLINLGFFASEGKAKEAIQHMRDTIQQYAQARGGTQQQVGAGFGAMQGPQAMKQQGTPTTVRLKDGSIVQAIRMPDGSLVRQ